MENEELIRRQMERTRESLTDKIETLEAKVMNSVHEATSAVSETVANVKETMHEGVETVKDAVDIKAHVERHPWLMLGGSILTGYVIGNLLASDKKTAGSIQPGNQPSPNPAAPAGNGRHRAEKAPAPATGESWLGPMEPEIQHLKGLAVGVALGTLREMLTKEVPAHMAEQLRTIIDGITKKMGGEPVPSSDFAAAKAPTPGLDEPAECTGCESEKLRW